jgi:transcriptional regulator with XRE-family HTH domain
MGQKSDYTANKRKIRALYEAIGLTRKDIAAALGVAEITVTQWLTRGRIPENRLPILKRLAKQSKVISEQREQLNKDYLGSLKTEQELPRGIGKSTAVHTLPTEELVAELEARGWEVLLKPKQKDSKSNQ